MKYPNIKPQPGEQQDISQRRYPADNIELAGPQSPTTPPQPQQPSAAIDSNQGGSVRPQKDRQ